jgi:hypothetical protein
MAVPPKTDPRWRAFVTIPGTYSFQLLATKIAYNRVKRIVSQGDESSINEAIDLLHGFFSKNERITTEDLRKALR